MPHVKIEVIEDTASLVVMEGTSHSCNGTVVGRYDCKTGRLTVYYSGTYRSIRHIIDGMRRYLERKKLEVKKVIYR